MKQRVTLDRKEIEEAILKYVEEKTGIKGQSVFLRREKGDTQHDRDTWTAEVSE